MKLFLELALVFGIGAMTARLVALLQRPQKPDLARVRGREGAAIAYAYTLAMLPWSKESTRIHWLDYSRGVIFHLGIAGGLITLTLSFFPGLTNLPAPLLAVGGYFLAIAFICGAIGLILRATHPRLRSLSTPDDYLAVILVAGFVGLSSWVLVRPEGLSFYYGWAAIMFTYLPFSKIRHFLYWFFARFFLGQSFGRRGVLPHPRMEGGSR